MHALRVVRDDDVRARAALWELRDTPDYARAFEEDEPLVTILVSTYRNWPSAARALPAVDPRPNLRALRDDRRRRRGAARGGRGRGLVRR